MPQRMITETRKYGKKVTATMRVNVTAITLKSGIKKTVTITVKKPVVKTRKITKVPSKISFKRGKSYLLKPVLTSSNSTEKKTYTSGNISARCKVTVK